MKRIALIVDSLDKIFPNDDTLVGGANKVCKYLIDYFANSDEIETDIYCGISSLHEIAGINKIEILGFCPFSDKNKFFNTIKEKIKNENYDAILSSDILAPFGSVIVQAHSVLFKNKNCKTLLESLLLKIIRRKKIKEFKALYSSENKKAFTMSENLRNDYINNTIFEPENIICVYPGVEQINASAKTTNEAFTFGISAGNAFNKGGILFLFSCAILNLLFQSFRAKIIIPKNNQFMKILVILLGLKNKVDFLPYQKNMVEFYTSVDCLVLPSINEAFGLVVLEAAMCKTASIVSSTSGVAEIIDNEENGFIFFRGGMFSSLLNLTVKMFHVLHLPMLDFETVCENAFETSKKYTWDAFAKKIIENLF